MTIDDMIDHSDYELFTKVCSGSHFVHHLLPSYRTSDLRLRGHPFQLPDYYTDLHKSCLWLDLCMHISNRLVLVVLLLCVFLLLCFLCFIAIMCLLMCVCRILIKITYLLTYLYSFSARVQVAADGVTVRPTVQN